MTEMYIEEGNRKVTFVSLNDENNWTATVNDLPTTVNGQKVHYIWKEQQVLGYTGQGTEAGNTWTFTNVMIVKNQGTPKGKTRGPGNPVEKIEDYKTPLGVSEIINHVGDCFD